MNTETTTGFVAHTTTDDIKNFYDLTSQGYMHKLALSMMNSPVSISMGSVWNQMYKTASCNWPALCTLWERKAGNMGVTQKFFFFY